MNELMRLYAEMEKFEKEIEKDSFTDTTLAEIAFQEYINDRFDQIDVSSKGLCNSRISG